MPASKPPAVAMPEDSDSGRSWSRAGRALWRGRPWITLSLSLGLIVLAYVQLNRIAGLSYLSGAPAAIAHAERSRFDPLASGDERQLREQRDLVNDLARRHVGSVLTGRSAGDLRVLQQILDREVIARDETYALQALGVAFGDVIAAQLGLSWVVVSDDLGRSRALRLGQTEVVIFPVTMISKRVERRVPFSVDELYQKVVETLRTSAPGSV
jgi:hypothetical protein